jgi:hypothetical protein
MKAMIVTTESGSVYDIDENGVCLKKDSTGRVIDAFKPFHMAPVADDVKTLADIYGLPQGDPVVGQRFYISGLSCWWLSTPVVSVSYENKEKNGKR